MSQSNLTIVRSFWDSINGRDVNLFLSAFLDEAVAHDPYGSPPLSSESARRAYLEGLLESLPELRAKIDFQCGLSDRTAIKWMVTGRSAEGAAVKLEGIDVYRHAEDGRIAEMWGFFR